MLNNKCQMISNLIASIPMNNISIFAVPSWFKYGDTGNADNDNGPKKRPGRLRGSPDDVSNVKVDINDSSLV